MKKILSFCLIICALAIGGAPAQALADIAVGNTMGSGIAGPEGNFYLYFGGFSFDNITQYQTPLGPQTLKTIAGDVGQFTLNIHSSGVPVTDYSAGTYPIPPNPPLNESARTVEGDYTWALNNQFGIHGSELYGTVQSFTFNPIGDDGSTGTVSGTLLSNGYFHWYYGCDNEPHGQTSLASIGLSDIFNFQGSYTIGGGQGPTLTDIEDSEFISYNLNGTLYANPVPIPGALWLFGPGLLGLVGLKRKYLG